MASPTCGPGEVLVSVTATGICGSEIEAFAGRSDYRTLPRILGHEIVGIIVAGAISPDTTVVINPIIGCGRCAACGRGDQQLCRERKLLSADLHGGHAELIAVPAANVLELPAGIDTASAVLCEPLAIAIRALRGRELTEQRIAIIGAGAVGLLVTRACSILGAQNIFVVEPDSRRLGIAEAWGAIATSPAELRSLEPDLVVDAVGSRNARRLAFNVVQPGGEVILLGLAEACGLLNFSEVVRHEVRVRGSYAYAATDFALARDWIAARAIDATRLVRLHKLADGPAVFDALARRDYPFVKAALVPDHLPSRVSVSTLTT